MPHTLHGSELVNYSRDKAHEIMRAYSMGGGMEKMADVVAGVYLRGATDSLRDEIDYKQERD